MQGIPGNGERPRSYDDDVARLQQDSFPSGAKILATPSRVFVLMPTVLVRDAVPKALRRYISMSTTDVLQVWFVLVKGDQLTSEQFARLKAIIDSSAVACSANNFNFEKAEIAAMQAEGVSVVDVDVTKFRQSSLLKQRSFLDEVRADPTFSKDMPDLEATFAAYENLEREIGP